MTSPGGQEVGRVSIRVVPDTSRFRRTLQKDLEKIQRSMKVEIPVELDMKGIRTQIAAIRRMLQSMRGVNIPVGVDDRVTQNMKRITTQARTLNGAIAGLGNSFRRFGRVARTATDDVRLRLMATGTVIRRIATQNPFRTIASGARASLRGVRNLSSAVFNMDLSFRRVRRSSTLLFSSLAQGSLMLGKGILTPLTGIFKAFSSLNRVGWITVAVLAAIPPLLGLIGTLIAGLPSLLLAFGAAAGVVALGVDGIKKAFEDFMPAIQKTRDAISAVFQEGLTPMAQNAARVINALRPELEGVAAGLVEMARGFEDAITSAEGMSNIRTFLANLQTFFAALRPVMAQFTESFLFLAAEGSKHFGFLTDVFQRFANAWDTMIRGAVQSGVFEDALYGLAQVLDSLLISFVKLVDVGMVAMAELGGPLSEGFTKLIDLIVAMMPGLTAFAIAILDVVSALSDALVPVFDALSPLLKTFFQQISSLLIPVINALAPVLQKIIEFALKLFTAFEPLFPVITMIANVIADVLMTALKALEPVLPIIASAMQQVAVVINTALRQAMPVLQEIAVALGQAIVQAIRALAPYLPTLIKAFLDLVKAVLPILPPLIQLIASILPPLIQLVGTLLPPIMNLAGAFINWLMPAVRGVIDVMQKIINWLGGVAKAVGEAGASVINWFKDLPGKLWNWVKDAGSWLFNAGKNIITGLWNGIVDMWNRMVGWLGDLLDGLVSQVTGILQINSPSKVFRRIGEYTMEGFALGIQKVGPDAVKNVEDVAKRITGIGSNMSAEVNASGGMTLAADNIQGAIERGISGWELELDKFGVGRLNRSAERDNRFGR